VVQPAAGHATKANGAVTAAQTTKNGVVLQLKEKHDELENDFERY
jgi:hypothetical protein